jgi:hypothetical protein
MHAEIETCPDTLLDGNEPFQRPDIIDFNFKERQEIVLGGVKYLKRTIIEILANDLEVY